jgi:thiamine biosynthesis protein ThiS
MPVVTVNGTERALVCGWSVLDLLQEMHLHRRLLLIRINGRLIQKPDWASVRLQPDDTIDIEHVIHGGG